MNAAISTKFFYEVVHAWCSQFCALVINFIYDFFLVIQSRGNLYLVLTAPYFSSEGD